MKKIIFDARPWLLAATVAGAFVLIKVILNLSFMWWIPRVSDSISNQHNYDMIKDFGLVAITGGSIFALSYVLFLRLYRTTEALLAAERKALAGVMGMAVSHDINNLLTIVDGYAQLLTASSAGMHPKSAGHLVKLNDGLGRLKQLTARINTAGKNAMQSRHRCIDLSELIKSTTTIAQGHKKLKQCDVDFIAGKAVTTLCNPGLIQDAAINLMLNAADAMGHKGNIQVRLVPEKNWVSIEVHDNGPGISSAMRERIFEPFYTTKTEGMGLGLLSARASAEAHGGEIEVLQSELGGACFRLRVPLRANKEGSEAVESGLSSSGNGVTDESDVSN